MTDKGTEMMKHWITRLTALLLAALMTTTALAANASGYSDVPDGHWAAYAAARSWGCCRAWAAENSAADRK